MPSFTIRKFAAEDIPQVMALQQAYQQVYPQATVIPGEVYLSPGFAEGENIFCNFHLNPRFRLPLQQIMCRCAPVPDIIDERLNSAECYRRVYTKE